MKNIITRNLFYSLVYFCFGALFIVSCSQDATDTFDSEDTIALRNTDKINVTDASLKEIPKEFYDNAEEYASKKLSAAISIDDIKDVNNLDDCIWIDEEGYAHIKDGCSVDSSIPNFGCRVVARGIGDCYQLANNPDCIVCIIWVVLECDDKLYWYNKWYLIC